MRVSEAMGREVYSTWVNSSEFPRRASEKGKGPRDLSTRYVVVEEEAEEKGKKTPQEKREDSRGMGISRKEEVVRSDEGCCKVEGGEVREAF